MRRGCFYSAATSSPPITEASTPGGSAGRGRGRGCRNRALDEPAVRVHDVPELLERLALGLTGGGVADEGVERPAGVRHLAHAVLRLDRAELRSLRACARRRLHAGLDEQRRPVLVAR